MVPLYYFSMVPLYHSPGYQAVVGQRFDSADSAVIIIDGD